MKRFSINVDDLTYARMKALAEKTGQPMSNIAHRSLETHMPAACDDAGVTKKRVEEILATETKK